MNDEKDSDNFGLEALTRFKKEIDDEGRHTRRSLSFSIAKFGGLIITFFSGITILENIFNGTNTSSDFENISLMLGLGLYIIGDELEKMAYDELSVKYNKKLAEYVTKLHLLPREEITPELNIYSENEQESDNKYRPKN